MSVVTRFAPSPTGMLHIGSARTALFNYLFARRHNGTFLLRIEDTDLKRSTDEAKQAILDGLEWLGLSPDAEPLLQSAQAGRHREVADVLLENGAAFRCYATPEELQGRRDMGQEKRLAAKADDLTETQRQTLLAEADALLAPYRSPWRDGRPVPSGDAPFTVRLRAPDTGEQVIVDGVQGRVTIQADEIDDLILLRADGSPTYMLAVVVDDHDMGVTHIIRGDDHLRNAFRQVPIYAGMGWDVPEFSHVPLIHGQDGAKLSKRHGALSTLAYRDMGYLPEAMNAYLLRLGWSHGDQELFTEDEAIAAFSVQGIGKAPGRLDFDKLGAVNAHFIRACNTDRLLGLILPFLEEEKALSPGALERVTAALPHIKDRGQTLPELAQACGFLSIERPISLNKKARKTLKDESLTRLSALQGALQDAKTWKHEELAQIIALFCSAQGLSMGQVGQPLRAALTGGLPAPDIAPVLEWLGRDEALARINDQIHAAGTPAEDA